MGDICGKGLGQRGQGRSRPALLKLVLELLIQTTFFIQERLGFVQDISIALKEAWEVCDELLKLFRSAGSAHCFRLFLQRLRQ